MSQFPNFKISSEIRPKDFLETSEGLVFAVVAHGIEKGRALVFLRYIKSSNSKWQKLDTDPANAYLKKFYPSYLFHSSVFDADLHAVPVEKISKHHKPAEKLQSLIKVDNNSFLQTKLTRLVDLLIENEVSLEQVGVTGSFLIGAENERSDIDLVIYDRQAFHHAREVIKALINKGELSALDEDAWKESYDRRSCSLTFEEYSWHEKQKLNKAIFRDIKFDLSLVVNPAKLSKRTYSKKGKVIITAEVLNDLYAFDTPCSYLLNHPEFKEVICFTPTYAGQAVTGDTVEVSGMVEEADDNNEQRIVVGSSREAPGEYIKVVR